MELVEKYIHGLFIEVVDNVIQVLEGIKRLGTDNTNSTIK